MTQEGRMSEVQGQLDLRGGLTGSELARRSWRHMISRCFNPDDRKFPLYGGRGVTVCERWRRSFAAFLEDLGPRPGPQWDIDRIDPDDHYRVGNCRWRLKSENSRDGGRRRIPEIAVAGDLVSTRVEAIQARRRGEDPDGQWWAQALLLQPRRRRAC